MRERKNANTHQTLYLFLGFLFLFVLSFSLGVIVGKGLGRSEKMELVKGENTQEPSGKEIAERERITDKTNNEDEHPGEQTPTLTKQQEAQIEVKEIIEGPLSPPTTAPVALEQKVAEQTAGSAKPAETKVKTQTEAPTPQELTPTPVGTEETKDIETVKKEEPKPQKEIAALPKIDPEGKYTVQVGSFQDEKKAKELLEALKLRRYPVFLKQVDIPGSGTWYRARIGTFKTREEARLYSDNIKNREPDIIQLAFVTIND